jgi:hypothetical protein
MQPARFTALTALLLARESGARTYCVPETRCANAAEQSTSALDGPNLSRPEFFSPAEAISDLSLSNSELAAYNDGMQLYAIADTSRCQYGHTSLAAALLPLNETAPCADSRCESVTYHFCACVSRERAVAARDPGGEWAGFGVLCLFATVFGVRFVCHTREHSRSARSCGRGDEAAPARLDSAAWTEITMYIVSRRC